MASILVDGEELDLRGNARVLLTYTLADIVSIDGRTGGYSNAVSLAWTKKNLALLDFFNLIQVINTGKKPSKKINCNVRLGADELRKGFLQIVDYTENVEVNVILYGENADLYNRMKDRPISELDFSEYDHTYTDANVQASWDNTDGYVYPIINFGKLDTRSAATNTSISNTRIVPYVYEHTVIRKILEKAGYTLKSQFVKTFMGGRPMVNNGKRLRHPDSFKSNRDFKALVIQNQLIGNETKKILFPNDQKPNGNNGGLCYDPALSRFTCDGPMKVSFSGYLRIGIGLGTVTLKLFKNGLEVESISTLLGFNAIKEISFSTQTYDASSADYFELFLTSDSNIVIFSSEPVPYWQSDVKLDLALGATIRIGAALPDVNQDVFFKDYFKRFALIIQADPYSGEVILEPYEHWIKPLKEREDWSDKLDVSRPIEGDFEINTYARNNLFKYGQDNKDTLINEGQINSDSVFTLDNDFVEQSKDLIVSMYAPTALGKSFNDQLILPCMKAEDDPDENADFTPRVLLYYGLAKVSDDCDSCNGLEVKVTGSSVTTWRFNNQNLTEIPFAYFTNNISGYGLNSALYEFLDFTYLKDRFYTVMLSRVQNSRIKKVYLNLSSADILNLDFSKPIYLARFNACFYLNKVIEKDLTFMASTKVELLTL